MQKQLLDIYPYEIKVTNPIDANDDTGRHDDIAEAIDWLKTAGLKTPDDWKILECNSTEISVFGFKKYKDAVVFKVAFG